MEAASLGHVLVLNLRRRDSGVIEGQINFSSHEVEMPGYIEQVEAGYADTAWRPERVWVVPEYRTTALTAAAR